MPPPRPLTSSSFADALGLPSAASNSAMTALYSAALGPVQLPRYLALFERFDRAGRAPIGWNSAARWPPASAKPPKTEAQTTMYPIMTNKCPDSQ